MFNAIIRLSYLFVKLAEEFGTVPSRESKDPSIPPQLDLEMAKNLLHNNKQFNFEEFSKLDYIKDVLKYADETLFPISVDGRPGTSRKVYDLSKDRVLKIAVNHSGIAQNTMEARLHNRNPLLATVYDMHPRSLWIIAEKIWPFQNAEEFLRNTEIPESLLTSDWSREMLIRMTPGKLKLLKKEFNLSDKAVYVIDNISKILALGILKGDSLNPEHWGFNESGDLKLLDFGLDLTTWKSFYTEEGLLKEE